jgi:hypothetical protein
MPLPLFADTPFTATIADAIIFTLLLPFSPATLMLMLPAGADTPLPLRHFRC